MKIDSATIGMESARKYQSSKIMTKRFWAGQTDQAGRTGGSLYASIQYGGQAMYRGTQNSGNEDENNHADPADTAGKSIVNWQNRFGVSAARVNLRNSTDSVMSDIRQLTIRYIFRLLFGNRGKHSFFDEANENVESGEAAKSNIVPQPMQRMAEYYESEQEETSFATTGLVRTSDGREIQFQVNVAMSRSFERYYNQEIPKTNLCDPLVINLDTDVASLDDQTFYFDIDGDGELDEVSALNAASGYLALDKNGDGTINDGKELFGTASGDGFKDLSEYDQDHNGWIDENDEIWSKLKIWTKDSDGRDILYSLSDKNVGAIYLGNVSTDHTLRGDDGQIKGAIRSSGVFLYENGNVGTVQHVDVAKYAKLA